MSDRFKKAFQNAWMRTEERRWIYGNAGKKNADGTYTFLVPGRPTFIYVTLRMASGAQTVIAARNDASVPHEANLPVRLKQEQGVYVIDGKSGRQDLADAPASPPSGVHAHDHALLDLTDTPASYTGHAGKSAVVNATEDALEFTEMMNLTSAQSADGDKTFTGDVIIGSTGSFGSKLSVLGTDPDVASFEVDGNYARVHLASYRNSALTHAELRIKASRGTKASPTAILSGDLLFNIRVEGYGTSAWPGGNTGEISFEADGNHTNTSQPGRIVFKTAPSGSTTAAERVRIGADGAITTSGEDFTFGNGTASSQVHINGAAGQIRDVVFETNGSARWILRVTADAESGSNAGSNLLLNSRTDAAGFLRNDLSINRATGEWSVGNSITIANGARFIGYGAKATNANGFRIEDDAGNLGIFVQDATGYVGVGTTTPELITASFSHSSTAVSIIQSGGKQYGRFIVSGSVNASFEMVDTGAGAGDKWGSWVCEAGVTRFLSLTDAGAINFDNILAMKHSNGYVGFGRANPGAVVHVEQATLGSAVFALQSVATNDDPTDVWYHQRVATTNATTTTIATIAIPSNTTVLVSFDVIARRTGGTGGAAGDSFVGVGKVLFKNISGTVTNVGSIEPITYAGDFGGTVSVAVSGTNALIRVAGAVNNNITWHVHYQTKGVSS